MIKRLLLSACLLAAIGAAVWYPTTQSEASGYLDPSYSCELLRPGRYLCEGVDTPGMYHSWSATAALGGSLGVSAHNPYRPGAVVTCSGNGGTLTHTVSMPYYGAATTTFRFTCPGSSPGGYPTF